MDCSPPGSSVLGIYQARILEWAAIPFSRESSQPRDQTQVSCIEGGFFTIWATREAPDFKVETVKYLAGKRTVSKDLKSISEAYNINIIFIYILVIQRILIIIQLFIKIGSLMLSMMQD